MADDRIAELVRNRDLLTQTGPGTPGGDLLRRYWQPVSLSHDLPPGGAPQAVRVLGEELVLFRDEKGRPGLLGIKCAHRCADLSYGRLEDGGLRCVYHGWLYDVNGKCLDQPAEPNGGAKDRIKQLSYPLKEIGGAIWAYMGPGEAPAFPLYAALTAPDAYRYAIRWPSACNYLQGNEGNIDPVHTSYLHRFDLKSDPSALRNSVGVFQVNTAPKLSVQPTRFGLRIFTERRLPEGDKQILRVTNFVMPNACAIGGYENGLGRGGCTMGWHVPIDDRSHYRYEFIFHSKKPLPRQEIHDGALSEWSKELPLRRNPANRYLQDREEQKGTTFLGLGRQFTIHDIFATESQGAILDHTKENLASCDVAIARARRMILEGIADMQQGKDPRGIVRTDDEFRDIVVLTEPLPVDADIEAFAEQMANDNIYALDPALA